MVRGERQVACFRVSDTEDDAFVFALSEPRTGCERRCPNVPFFLSLSSVSEMSTHRLKRNAGGTG